MNAVSRVAFVCLILSGAAAARAQVEELKIQAYVDGPSTLHVTPTSLYWVNGDNAKPGRQDGQNYPTYVNGEEWLPQWRNGREARGSDQSAPFPVKLGTVDLDFELVAVGDRREDTGIHERTPVNFRKDRSEYRVLIPDPENGAQWYTFVLRKRNDRPVGGAKVGDASDEYQLVLWNQHNGDHFDRGTKRVRVEALRGGSVVWKADSVALDWSSSEDVSTTITVPPQRFSIDQIRITILEWVNRGGGLAEIEVRNHGEDVTKACKVSVSAFYENDDRYARERLTDGITTSRNHGSGYWLLPDEKRGTITIDLPKR